MKRKSSYILSLLALVLILCAFIQPAWAYFTSSKEADGSVPISFVRKTTIEEKVDKLTKSVTVRNDSSSTVDVWVRVRAHAGAQYKLNVGGSGWSQNGDWWYFNAPVAPGKTANPLAVTLVIPEDVKPTDVVNVGVIYESTTVFYKPDGSPDAPNWSAGLLDAATSKPLT